MSRPTDWSPVGWGHDPIPGDPLQVSGAATNYRSTAEAIRTASSNLRRLDGTALVSKAFQVAFERIEQVAGKLDSTETRVSGVANALDQYWPELERQQQASLQQLAAAEASATAKRGHDRQITALANAYNSSNDIAVRESLHTQYDQATRASRDSSHAIDEARRRIQDAVDVRNNAAKAAIESLNEVDQSSPVKDSFFDKVGDFYEKNIEPAIKAVVKAVAEFAEKYKTIIAIVEFAITIAALVANFFVPGISFVVGAALFEFNSALSVCKMANAGYQLQDGTINRTEFLTILGVETLSVGLGALSVGFAAGGLGAAPIALTVANVAKEVAGQVIMTAAGSVVEAESTELVDLAQESDQLDLQQQRIDQEQRMREVDQQYRQGQVDDAYSRELVPCAAGQMK